MAMEEKDIYAVLGLEVPSQKPEAADPAAGANDPGAAAPDGAGGQNDASPAGSGRTDPSTAYGGPPPLDRGGFGGASKGAPAGSGRTDSSAAPRNDGAGETAASGARRYGDGDADSSTPLRSAQNDRTGETSRQIAGAAETEAGTQPQSRAERAEQARLRRERETNEKISAAVAKALEAERAKHAEELKGIFAQAGMTDRYNGGKPITSKEEFDAWQDRARTERLSRQLRDGSLTPEAFQQAVDASPTVRAAKDFMDRMEAAEQERKARETEARFKEQVAAELTEIRELDPGVNSLEDAIRLPTGPEFVRLVRDQGMRYIDAFRLANFDRIQEARAQAAAQGAALRQNGKAHLRSVVQPGEVPMEVPRDIVERYRLFQPDMSLEEIRQDYAKRYTS